MAQATGEITLAELEVITQSIVRQKVDSTDSLTLIPPRDKMKRNGLSEETGLLINIGLLQSQQVQIFVETTHSLDNKFVDRLTSGFVAEYQLRKESGLEGDTLFEAMRLFSCQGRTDLRFQGAGLAVLAYLFERCEVFEK